MCNLPTIFFLVLIKQKVTLSGRSLILFAEICCDLDFGLLKLSKGLYTSLPKIYELLNVFRLKISLLCFYYAGFDNSINALEIH